MRLRFCLTDKFIAGFIALNLCLSTNLPELKAESEALGQGSVTPVNAMDVSIPEEIGTLKEKFEGRDGRIVFILQDAHAVPDAQRNIQKIIDYVQREYGVALVGLEGAALPLDALLLQSFPDQARLREVFEEYFQRGELTGASAAALFNQSPAVYQGVEDWELYEEGLGLFLRASELESSLTPELNRLFSSLEIEKEKIYSPELLRVDRAIESYHNNQGDLAGLLEILAAVQAPEPGSETALLAEAIRSSGRNDETLDREVRRAAEEVRAALSGRNASKDVLQDLALFNRKFQEFQNSLIPPEALALSLKELAFKYRIRVQISEPMRKRIMTQKRIRDLEGTKLFDQVEAYARSVKGGLFKSDQERALDTLGREYSLIRKLGRLELSRSEWLELKKLLTRQEAWPIRQDGVDGAEDASRVLSRMTPNVDFYRNTEKRDGALFTNTEALMRDRSEHSALLVAGGFHADALTYQLKAKGISYVLVMPAISNLPEQSAYRDHMTGKVSWSRYFEARNGRVNLYEAFVRGARDALLEGVSGGRGPMLKLWRDSVIRALAARGRVSEASQYTRFIDETAETSEQENRDHAAFLEKWKRSVDVFIEKVKELRSADQLTQESVVQLFTPAMIPAATDISMARSELRMDLLPAVLSQLAVSEGLRRKTPAAEVLQDHGKKIQLLVTQGIGRNVRENSRVLEMGIGSGVMTKVLMESAGNVAGVSFLGLDINPEAVTAARQMLGTVRTALPMKHSFEVRQSDLFSAVKSGELFDVIFWNPPWSSETSEGALSLAKNDPGFLTLRRFLREAGKFLAPQGKIFLILPPESMEEIWEDAQLLYDISPVPMFERTERRRIGLYTLTARSELREEALPPLKYEMQKDDLDQAFWSWLNEDLPERRLDRELFEKIVTGGDGVLKQLLQDYPDKVYVKEVVREPDQEGWSLNEKDGRTVYLKLSSTYQGINTLRLKGVRPRRDGEGRFLGYHEMGRGFVPVDSEAAGPGKIRFWKKAGGYKVFGGASVSSTRHEQDVLKAMASAESLAPHADRPLGSGFYSESVFGQSSLGFIVIGMKSQDRRIAPGVVMDDDSEDEDARKLVFYVSDYETHQKTELSPRAAESFAGALGALMRRYHDAGFYHGFPHFENFGLKPGADPESLKAGDLVVRDLGTTVLRSSIAAADETEKTAMAAMYRWMDLTKSVRYFQRHDNQSNDYFLKMAFLKAYAGSEEEARILYEPLSRAGFDWTLNYYFNENHYESVNEKILDFDLPQYAAYRELYEFMKRLERQEPVSHPASRSELRGAEAVIQKWNERYFRQPGKPDDEPGHLGVQFRDVNMETGPGSIYEFDFLKEAARVFLADRDLGLTAQEFASRTEIEKILQLLSSSGVIDEALVTSAMGIMAVLEGAAGKYHSDAKLTGLTDRGEFFQNYYRAASASFRLLPVLVEAMARISSPAPLSRVHELEDGLEVQSSDSLHFSLEGGFQISSREQIGLPEGKDALSYFREEPSRAIAVYLRSVEFELPLSHEIRLALIRYQPELQGWLDQQRTLETPSDSFKRASAHFLKIMESRQSVIGVLWEMYRIGILDALVPEMRRVRDIPSNFNVHAFTVGQHTMYNLKKFEDLRVTQDPQLQDGREIASGLSASGLRQIRLSLLFHDLGKRMVKTPVEPDHAIVSSRDIIPVRFRELGVSPAETANAAWTVRDHMVLNAFARMQDVRFEVKLPVLLKTFGLDPEASLEKLKLLYLISLTDRDSVNPWFPFMGPEILDRLNYIYQTLEDYFKTSEQDRPRHILDMQIEAHERTYLEWLDYKALNSERLRGILSQMSVPAIRGYFRNVPIVDEGQFEKVRQGLIDRAARAAADEGSFDGLMERLFAAFPMDQIRDYSEDEAVQRLLFLLHLDYQKDTGNRAPVVYFNPQLSRTYERGYEIVVGSPEDREGFFEKTTGVLFRHRFDIEEADIRTLTSVEVIDTFQGFFQDDYPDEAAHVRLQDQLTRDLRDVFTEALPSVKALFDRDGKAYLSERTLGPIATKVQFVEDTDIYGTRASVFSLKTANRLGLLHTLSLALNQRGINLVAAPVSTHPSMVNDTFYVNRDGKVLEAQEKEALASFVQELFSEASIELSGVRSELRTSHLDLLWPQGVTDKDFTRETFGAWKADWLAEDSLAAGLRAWEIGDTLTFEFTGSDGAFVALRNAPARLSIRQNDSGRIISIESKGFPGIDSKEMLRGVLNWMKDRGVDYVQMDVTYPLFLDAVRDEWNRTRAAGPDPYVLPIRPAGNGTRMYFYLNLLNLERVPSRSELRSGEESKLFQVLGPQEGARVQYQARWFADAFRRLDPESRKKFLYPNLLLTLLGVKPVYLAVEEGAPSPGEMMSAIDPAVILAGSRLVFYADGKHLIALLPAAVKILSERAWLEQKRVLGAEDASDLDLMDQALKSGDTRILFSKTHELMMRVRSNIEAGESGAMEKAHWFYGLLFGYPKADMESYARVLSAEGRPSLEDPRYVHSRYSKVSLFTESSDSVWMARAEAALDYAFSLLQGVPGFEEASEGYETVFSPEVTAELERLYKEDEGKDPSLLARPEWPALNRVFDGDPQDVRGSELVLKRALETMRRLDIRPGDTLADLGAGERGGLGLIAAMLGAHVTAVESKPESVRKIREHYERLSGVIAAQGGRFEIVQADLGAADTAAKLGQGKFRHVIMTDTVTPSRAMADRTPSAPPTYEPGKVQRLFKTAGALKSGDSGRVLFSVPEYVQAGGRMTAAVPFLEDFALAVMKASGTGPSSAVFVSVPYSDAIKRGVLYEFKPVKRSELRASADEERTRLESLSGQDWKSITLEHLEVLIARAKEKGREDLAAAGEEHTRRMTGNLDRPMVRTDGNDFVGLHSAFFDSDDPRRKRIVLEQLTRVTNALPGALFTGDTVARSRSLFSKLYESDDFNDLLDSEAFLAASLYRRSSVRSELRALDDKSQFLRRVTTETLGVQNPHGERVLRHRSFEGVLWIWAGQFAYRVEPDLAARKFTFQRYSSDKQTPQGSVYTVPFDQDYIVGRGSGAVQGQYVLGTDTDKRLSRSHFKLRVSESVWETFFTLEDAGPEGQGSSFGTRAEWTQGDVVISKGFNMHSPSVVRQLSDKIDKLGMKSHIDPLGGLLPGEFSDGFYPLPDGLQSRVIQAMQEDLESGYGLTDYLLDRNLNSMISDALSLEAESPRIVYHPGIGTGVSNDGKGLAVLRTLIQTDFKTLVATDPAPYSLEEFKKALIRQLGGIAENITVRRDSRGAYLAFFTFNGTTREIIAYYGFDSSLKNPEEIKKGYQVLVNRRQPYQPVTFKAKVWAALNSRSPLVLDEAISLLDPVSGFIVSSGEDDVLNTQNPEPGLIGLDSPETLKRLPSLNPFVFISSYEYLGLVYEKYRAAATGKRVMPVLLGRSAVFHDSFRRKIWAARQHKDDEESYSLLSALRGGPDYAGHGSGSLHTSEQILDSGQLIHKKGFIQYAYLNSSTMRFPGDFESGGSSYDGDGTGLFVISDDFENGVDSVFSSGEDGEVVNTISLDHPKFLAAVFGARYVPGLKRKYPAHQDKIMSYGQAADYLTKLTRAKSRPDDPSSSKRSELRQIAETAVRALRPGASEDVKRLAAQSVYSSIQIDSDLFLELMEEIFQEKVLEAQGREDGSARSGDSALALQAAMDLARRLLVPKGAAEDSDLPSRKVTMAVHFSKTEDPVSFIQAMIQSVTEGNYSAEVLSDAGTHKAFSRQLTEPLREFFQLKKLKSSDLQKGTTVSVEGLGIATAMDAAEGADGMNKMFQGLFFDFEDAGEDPDLRLSGQVLFAALLIKLAVLSSENRDIPAAERAAFLKAELIRAVHEAGYNQVSQDSFQALGSNLIRIAGGSLIGSLIDEMKARTQIGQSA